MDPRSTTVVPKGAQAWGSPLFRLNQLWSGFETRLAAAVILAEVATLVVWVSLKGLAAGPMPGSSIGLVFRSTFSAIVLGGLSYAALRKLPERRRAQITTIACVLGLIAGSFWQGVGATWASNMVEWAQSSSVFMLTGGPRGLVTRFTLWVALLGASIAASRGKHINIDVAMRFLPKPAIKPAALVGLLAAALVCFGATWGFVDSIVVTKFRAPAFTACPGQEEGSGLCDTPIGERLAVATKGMSRDFFLLRRQLSLDLMSLPKVLSGQPYDRFLDAPTWNRWVSEGNWAEYFDADAVASLKLDETDAEARRMPAVVAPDTGENRGLLIRDLDFILPFGLLMIGLKFLLRFILVLSGHAEVEPDSAHGDSELHAGSSPTIEGVG